MVVGRQGGLDGGKIPRPSRFATFLVSVPVEYMQLRGDAPGCCTRCPWWVSSLMRSRLAVSPIAARRGFVGGKTPAHHGLSCRQRTHINQTSPGGNHPVTHSTLVTFLIVLAIVALLVFIVRR